MRQVTNAMSGLSGLQAADQAHYDMLFRDGKGRIVDPPRLPQGIQVADTHCHLDMLPHPGLALARAAYHQVSFVVTVVDPTEDPAYTYDGLSDWQAQAARLLDEWAYLSSNPPHPIQAGKETTGQAAPSRCRIIIGCHPHNAARYGQAVTEELMRRAGDQRTAAIGEIGLDYHYDASPREAQREAFRRQLDLALRLSLPVSLHLREAHDDGLAILDDIGWPPAGVLLHCCTVGPLELQPFLDRGALVAFGGTLTFKNAGDLRETARLAPLDRIMTETDAPFMAPTPLRGTPCGPEHTVFTAACLSDLRGADQDTEVSALLAQAYANALGFFDR
jgi:TatD DNase family protein